MQYLSYIIATFSLCSLLVTWFVIVYRQLSCCRDEIAKTAAVVKMHKISSQKTYNIANEKQAEKMLEISKIIYMNACDKYNSTLKKPFNRFPGWIMRFKYITTTSN